jgi:hypothetical protein
MAKQIGFSFYTLDRAALAVTADTRRFWRVRGLH